MQAAKLTRYVVRLAQNSTARRNELPPSQEHGRPQEYGTLVHPLARKRRGQAIAATPPDRQVVEMKRERYQALFEFTPAGYLLSDAAADIQRSSRGKR